MTHNAANVIVLVPQPARHIAPSPDVGDVVRPPLKKRTRRNMRYPGLLSGTRIWKNRRKYDDSLKVELHSGVYVRRLSAAELDEWHERIDRIIRGESQLRCEPLREKEGL